MVAWFVLGLQASDGAAAPTALPPVQVTQTCPAPSGGGDVVVCGSADQDQFRLKPVPERYQRPAAALPKAEMPLVGKVKAAAETEQADVGGFPSNRIMMRLKLPF